MSYVKNTWNTGDVITAEKLNHAEEGIEAASNNVFLVGGTYNSGSGIFTLNKTWQQIRDSAVSGKTCILVVENSFGSFGAGLFFLVDIANMDEYTYTVSFSNIYCECGSPSEYPSHSDS